MVLNDWNHDFDSNTAHLKSGGFFEPDGSKFSPLESYDSSKYSNFKWHSGLINGKGRYYDPSTRNHNSAPLSRFSVKQGETIRFRVISAGTMFPLRVSVDRHLLTMISSDGYRFENVSVESFILSPGERFDFLLTADETVGRYWIFAETTEVKNVASQTRPTPRHRAEAILEYEEAGPMPDTNYNNWVKNPLNRNPQCISSRCYVLNCPFGVSFVDNSNLECLHLTNLTSTENQTVEKENDFIEKFYNFAFFGGGSINGRHWEYPPVSAASQKDELQDVDTTCKECTKDKACSCTHTETLESNKYYQFVLINDGNGSGYAHPVHLHGHNFQVVKQGFSDDIFKSPDIKCLGWWWYYLQ
ncbi:hypothetical protein EB796_008155 [Bugula neritina]|uniref:Uncharacterized protein n=1 Tax=Bugula neritina TaxID=10212 RepID=A0A7J7K5S7_BUGNE|nr:hypothetical protein EB796_008155 [Bugula neritina]